MASTKLSPALKALIAAPHARGTALPAPSLAVTDRLFDSIRASATSNGIGSSTWLTLSVGQRSQAERGSQELTPMNSDGGAGDAQQPRQLDQTVFVRDEGWKEGRVR